MSETKIPGLKAQHMIVTDNCRQAHGGLLAALDEAYSRLRKTVVKDYLDAWPDGRADELHLVLTADLASHRAREKKPVAPAPLIAGFEPCFCEMFNAQPHFHQDKDTIIPWDVFCAAFEKFREAKLGYYSISGTAEKKS